MKTWWLASVGSGQSYYDPVSGLTTRQLQLTPDMTSAMVSICRNSSMVETSATCNNGLDDDCDGFIDGADSDCGKTHPPPRPPPPPALSPPRTSGTPRSSPLYIGHAMFGHTPITASYRIDCLGIPTLVLKCRSSAAFEMSCINITRTDTPWWMNIFAHLLCLGIELMSRASIIAERHLSCLHGV